MKVCFIGDSHINPIKLGDLNLLNASNVHGMIEYRGPEHSFTTVNGDDIKVRQFHSTTAVGLLNDSSERGAASRIAQAVEADISDGYENFAFCLGRVDLDFVFPYKKLVQRSNISFNQFAVLSVSNYMSFLIRLYEKVVRGRARFLILGLPAPVLAAEFMAKFVQNESLRKNLNDKNEGIAEWFENGTFSTEGEEVINVIGSLQSRTCIHRSFNTLLQENCKACGFDFLDLDPIMIDSVTGVIRPEFVEGIDHHANPYIIGPIWLQMMRWLVSNR